MTGAQLREHRDTLTPAQLRVLDQARRGLICSESAQETHHAPETVRFHRADVLRFFGARNMCQAIAFAYEQGIFGVEQPRHTVLVDGVVYRPA